MQRYFCTAKWYFCTAKWMYNVDVVSNNDLGKECVDFCRGRDGVRTYARGTDGVFSGPTNNVWADFADKYIDSDDDEEDELLK